MVYLALFFLAASLLVASCGIIGFFKRRKRLILSSPSSAPAPTTPPTLSPPPSASSQPAKINWAWPITTGILGLVVIFGLVVPELRKSATPPPVKKELKKIEKVVPLEFLGAEGILDRGREWIKIKKGGSVNFRVSALPIVRNGQYEIVFRAKRERDGRTLLKINTWGETFSYDNHPASDQPLEVAFFRQGMRAGPKYFLPAENFFKLSADDELLVQLDQPPYVKIIYWE